MFSLDASGITKSRQGYLFAYAQMTFNQVRRHANLLTSRDRLRAFEESQRGEHSDTGVHEDLGYKSLGWRAFTLPYELDAEELEIQILAVLSSALFLEAFIFDYCARRESTAFAKKYLDKLDPVAKWLIVSRLVNPPGLDQSSEVFERLRQLFALRNDLVHHKTREGSDFSTPPAFPEGWTPNHCLKLACDILKQHLELDSKDTFANFVLRHVGSWYSYASKDSRFYPILWEA